METAKALLLKLRPDGAQIDYDVAKKIAILHGGQDDSAKTPVSVTDLLFIFEKGWISRVDTSDGQHRYRINGAGRMALGG